MIATKKNLELLKNSITNYQLILDDLVNEIDENDPIELIVVIDTFIENYEDMEAEGEADCFNYSLSELKSFREFYIRNEGFINIMIDNL